MAAAPDEEEDSDYWLDALREVKKPIHDKKFDAYVYFFEDWAKERSIDDNVEFIKTAMECSANYNGGDYTSEYTKAVESFSKQLPMINLAMIKPVATKTKFFSLETGSKEKQDIIVECEKDIIGLMRRNFRAYTGKNRWLFSDQYRRFKVWQMSPSEKKAVRKAVAAEKKKRKKEIKDARETLIGDRKREIEIEHELRARLAAHPDRSGRAVRSAVVSKPSKGIKDVYALGKLKASGDLTKTGTPELFRPHSESARRDYANELSIDYSNEMYHPYPMIQNEDYGFSGAAVEPLSKYYYDSTALFVLGIAMLLCVCMVFVMQMGCCIGCFVFGRYQSVRRKVFDGNQHIAEEEDSSNQI